LIKKTVSAGRGAIMPAWLNEFGGPMRPDQVQNVTNYVLNWASPDGLCKEEPVQFNWPTPGPGAAAEYQSMNVTDPTVFEAQPGDPEAGAQAYLAYGCNACHGLPDEPGSNSVGPWLGDIATNAPTRIDGYSAEDYIYESILEPNAFIAPDCPNGPCTTPSLMRADYPLTIGNTDPQNMANLLAYLLGDAYTYP